MAVPKKISSAGRTLVNYRHYRGKSMKRQGIQKKIKSGKATMKKSQSSLIRKAVSARSGDGGMGKSVSSKWRPRLGGSATGRFRA